ncbi:MAG: hypothetical protein KatS3mg060_2222 [Dehalococcoidia bacterium]|nr:MAG: hypothetical protein KatS3mg060_2222 [Dehalococcoidia bacterium]
MHVAEEEGRLEQGAVRQSGNVETRRARRGDGLASPGLGVVEQRPDAPRFGTLGRLDYDALTDALCCHICGQWKRNLAQHARLAHRLSADAYRALAGLNRTTKLVTPTMRTRLREVGVPVIERLRAEGRLRRWDEDREKFRRDKAAAVEAIRQGLRQEGRRRRSEAFTTADERRDRAERRRQRNLAGLDRAAPAAIAAGIRRAAGERACERCGQRYAATATRQRYCPACRIEAEREHGRDSARRARLRKKVGEAAAPRRTPPTARDTSRVAVCPRCRRPFRAASHRDRYCPPCRPEAARAYQREWKAHQRADQAKPTVSDVGSSNREVIEK